MQEFVYNETRTKEDENVFLTKVLGFTGLAILLTAAFGYLFSSVFNAIFVDEYGDISEEGIITLLLILLGSFILSLILSIVGNAIAWKRGKTPYVSYVGYALSQGIFFGTFVILGIPSFIIGGALGITAIAFIIVFALGYLSKGRMGWAKLIVAAIGIGCLANFLVFGIFYLINPLAFLWMYPLVSIGFMIVAVLYIAIDANSVKHHIEDGCALTNSVAVSFAFTLYTDYMILFWKVLRILLRIYMIFGKRK